MSLGFVPLRRRFERLLAILSSVAVLMSMMVIFAPAALAHHPDLTGSVQCVDGDPQISYRAFSWTPDNNGGRYNSDIGVYVDDDAGTLFSGDEVEVATGKFLPGVGDYPVPGVTYATSEHTNQDTSIPEAEFSGSFNASAWAGTTLYLKTRADDRWWNNTAAGDTGQADDVIQLQVLNCAEDVTVTVSPSECVVNENGAPMGEVTVGIDPNAGATVGVYTDAGHTNLVGSFSGAGGSQELSPGTYYWQATAASGFDLTGAATGSFTIDPCAASAVVVSGVCLVRQGAALGSVQVTIDPTSGATVNVYDSEDDLVGSFTNTGGIQELPPGGYTWEATPGIGYSLPENQQSGSFTIAPCDATVVVVSGSCEIGENGAPLGLVEVTIDPTSGATVTISGSGGPYVFSGDGGSQELAPGTYTWQANAEPGYQFDEGEATSGDFTIEPCEATVVVTGQCLVDGDTGFGQLNIEISTDGAAAVEIFDGPNLVGTFTESGSISVGEDKTYNWSAEPITGFEIVGDVEGSVDVEECSRSILVDANTACLDNIPYLIWDITPINFDSDEVTVTWVGLDPSDPQYSSVQGLQGQMPWPGVVLDEGVVVDWPGWIYVKPDTLTEVPLGTEGGIWAPGADGHETLRPQTSVEFSVNPTTVVVVDYPNGDPDCEGPLSEIFIEIGSMCLDDTPYLTYEATLSGNVQGDLTASIHWFDKNSVEQLPADGGQAYSGLPLSGSVLWPGARIGTQSKPVDWPGWTFVLDSGSSLPLVDTTGSVTDANGATGKWVQGDDGFLWARETGAFVTIEVNSTSDPVQVSYPPGTPTCTAGPPDEVRGVEILPFTGMDSEILLGASFLMLGLGIYLIHRARREEEG